MANTIMFFLVTLVLILTVVARDCSLNITNCDDCFRCGGTWCYDKPIPECKIGSEDNICSAKRENLTDIPQLPDAKMVNVLVKHKEILQFNTSETNCELFRDSNIKILTTTQTDHITTYIDEVTPDGTSCEVKIDVIPRAEFCTDKGTVFEHVSLKVSNDAESRDLKYQIPCACSCSQHGKVNASECNYRGDLVCGACINCHTGWEGKKCEQEICPRKRDRGDIPQFNMCTKNKDCNGNGECRCGQCRCFPHLDGFFVEYCRDICTVTREMDRCFLDIDEEKACDGIIYEKANETRVEERKWDGSRIWMKCNITFDDCTVQYAATRLKGDSEYYTVMILKDCELIVGAATSGVTITVPAILGALALIAAAASVAGYMLWKNRSPPLPLSDPQYQNIDADFSQGENPLYKCPTSSFKNPTYGKC